jgi:ABC-type glycerol-3-phosphate transport system substrate-binding protein
MKLLVKSVLLAGAISVVSVASFADGHACANDVPVKTISNAFPAYETMTGVMQACGNVESELDKDHRLKIVDAFSASPALYTMTSVTNSTAVPMLDADLLRPLDDLIAAHGQNLKPNQFVKIDGETMAIAAFANTQHLMYREDILSDLGIAVPTTWGEYIAAAEKIQAAGVVDYPIGHYMKDGWNLAFVFLNHYLGEGGEFFNDDWSPSINNEQGLAVLERMAKLATLMDPEYLVSDTTFVTKQLQQGKVAMANLWASRAGAVNDPAESSVAGKIIMAAGLRGSERIASTVWWDGWAIGKNISDAEAEAAMKLITASMAEDVIKEHNDDAIWLADGFVPSAAATGAFATVDGETADYPMNKYIGSMHAALGSGLAAFMTGDKDAATTLADIEAAYITDAKEKGLLD